MSSVLYQKYRSQDFEQLLGQENVTKLLKNSVKNNQLAQAYLFVGSRGTGKTSTARIFAKAVNCLNPKEDGNPCNECANCKSITEGSFLDLIEVDAASNRGIDQIRELKEKIEFSPSVGKYKVYIIDEVHMLTTEAFNALLKTLEEPPAHVIFILATTDVHKLPATILSRCQRYDFRLGTEEEINTLLSKVSKEEGLKIDDDALDVIVHNAKGSYRDALSLLDVVYTGQDVDKKNVTLEEVQKILGLPDLDKVLLLLGFLSSGDGVHALEVIEELENKGVNIQQFVEYTLNILREILTGKIKNDLEDKYSFANAVNVKDIYKMINVFLDAENKLRYANNQALVLEMIIPLFMTTDVATNQEAARPTTIIRKVTVKIPVKEEKKKTAEPKVVKEVKEQIVEKEEQSVEVAPQPSGDISLTLEDVNAKWDDFLKIIKSINGSLYGFLNGSNRLSFNNGVLALEVPFKFHKETIETPKCRETISSSFAQVYGVPCGIECTLNEKIRPHGKSDAEFVLRNLPVIKKEEKKEPEEPKKKEGFKQQTNKFSKEIDAMFDGI
ncbi:DNA polymerase III subunit gamma/tau [bacterium]|nr:DNA polymerase III subunit gamma/tau [bacterium]